MESTKDMDTSDGVDRAQQSLQTALEDVGGGDRNLSPKEMKYLVGAEEILGALRMHRAQAQESIVTMLPALPPAEMLQRSLVGDVEMVQRGVAYRSIYPLAALSDRWVFDYARQVAVHGAQVRSGQVGTIHFAIFDSQVVILSEVKGDARSAVALLTDSPGTVKGFIDKFELIWRQSVDLAILSTGVQLLSHDMTVLRFIGENKLNDAIARELDMTVPTVNRSVRRLKDFFEVESKGALQVLAHRLGLVRDER